MMSRSRKWADTDGCALRRPAAVLNRHFETDPHTLKLALSCGGSQVVQWLARYKPRQLAKSGAVKAMMQALCRLCAEPEPPDYDDVDQLPAAKFAAQV